MEYHYDLRQIELLLAQRRVEAAQQRLVSLVKAHNKRPTLLQIIAEWLDALMLATPPPMPTRRQKFGERAAQH